MSLLLANRRHRDVSTLFFLAARITTLILLVLAAPRGSQAAPQRWSPQQADAWYAKTPWPVGSNFIPSTAINELEMWQAETFDLPTIDRELAWAESLGMNTMRVFLHNLAWKQDRAGFLVRLEKFLEVADKHHIKTMFVLLDSVWDPDPKIGKQREPKPHVHNSGWVQAPGATVLKDPSTWSVEIAPYVKEVVGHFRSDRRVLVWDLMNEPDNENGSYKSTELPNKSEAAEQLLKKVWVWARDANPTQPLTSGVWRKQDYSDESKLTSTERFQLENSDVITFHNYDPLEKMQSTILSLGRFHRPILCTEYMARPRGSTFEAILPLLKREKIGAYNWGFVSGKTQTIYPWDSWEKKYESEPPQWFHDIFKPDGQPYDAKETDLVRRLTGKSPPPRNPQ